VNTGAPWPGLDEAEYRVRVMQTKLHQWAKADPGRRFDDLFNLVYDPAFLTVAWRRVRGNKGARTAGVDGVAPRSIVFGAEGLLRGLREDLKARRFVPQRVREKTIPKSNGKVRALGIPTTADRVVQASLKLVLEPIFEADFQPCSYGFRPKRRAQDAITEIHYLASPTRNYEWVFEADIEACFDQIDHTALMDRMRDRVGDKPVLALVKAFLRAGVLSEDGINRDTITGTRDDAEALQAEVAAVLAPMGLRLSEEKTRVCHIDEGFDFLGWRIQRRAWRSRAGKTAVYTYPSKKSLASIKPRSDSSPAERDIGRSQTCCAN
jgi:RNA-directed DNA polymerase